MSQVSVDKQQVITAYTVCKEYMSTVATTKKELAQQLNQISNEWQDPKYNELLNVVTDCLRGLDKPLESIEHISASLEKLLAAIEEYESTNLSGGNNSANSGVSQSSAVTSNIELPQSDKHFCGLPIRRMHNGTWGVVSSTQDQYDEYFNNMNDYSYEAFDTAEVRMIDAREISGIDMISDYDLENPHVFWGRSGGTYESFEAIAQMIPEVQTRLNNGERLLDLIEDERVGSCAGLFFNADSTSHPAVYEGDGFYALAGNGRHRVMLAQRLGYSIPMRVVGRIVRR